MSHTWDEIFGLIQARRNEDNSFVKSMIDVRDRYNGEVVIPLPDVDGEPVAQPSTPRLVADAIDHLAMRAGSTRPTITCPAVDSSSEEARERALRRRRALYSTWHYSALDAILLRRAYRHYAGYGTACFVVTPDPVDKRAKVELRDPLTAYPELRSPEDIAEPGNVGFVVGRPSSWLTKRYPETASFVRNHYSSETLWDIVEWLDEDDYVIGVLGPRLSFSDRRMRESFGGMELRRAPNRCGMVPVAIPRRVTMDRIFGLVASVIGHTDMLDKLMALDIIAAEKAIFADMVVIGKDGRTPQLVGGRWKDGREGEPNLITDVQDVKLLQSAPGPLTHPVIDRLTQNINTHTGLIPAMQGQLQGSLRTGRAIDAISGFSIDPRIQEAQEVIARSLSVVNRAILSTEKGYWPKQKFTVFSGWSGDVQHVEYTPNVDFEESTENVVTYTFPGTDISQLTVAVGQLVGAGLMSKATARNKHPFIPDDDAEGKAVLLERIEDSVLTSFLEQASSGTLPLVDSARVMELVEEGNSLVKSILQASREAQERQATQAPPADEGMALPPEAMPGLAEPGQGVESQIEPEILPARPSQENFRSLTRALRTGVDLSRRTA